MENVSFTQFLMAENNGQNVDPELTVVLHDIVSACKKIAQAVNKGALTGQMGSLGSENIQGERQKQLDVIADEIFIESCQASGLIAGMVSEELDDPFEIPAERRDHGKYLLLFDPLDGSSNVNVNISVGTIFSVLQSPYAIPTSKDFLQPGTRQVCAGYALYGSSTMLVFTTGIGVNGFTLDDEADEFFLTHPAMEIPPDTQEFAINMSNQRFWEPSVQRYIEECLQGAQGVRGKDFNMRWVASMVAEVHRILIRGGVFIYPADRRSKGHAGKLRLMYEANPMALIVEQAGGVATNGLTRILDISPEHIHQRVPVMLGSKNEIERLIEYHQPEGCVD